jgi:hypothetical protein
VSKSPESKRFPYWDNGGRRLLRELTYLYLHRPGPGGTSPTITHLANLLGPPETRRKAEDDASPKDRARYQRLRNFLFNLTDAPHSVLMNELFAIVVPWFAKQCRSGEFAKCGYLPQVESRGWFAYIKHQPAASKATIDAFTAAADTAAELADMLAIGFDITVRDYEEASAHLTGHKRCSSGDPNAADQVGFVTYRYSSAPGNIIRTFTSVTPVSSRYPFCWFQNFYRYPERELVRDSSGVVVKLGNAIYMLGLLPPHDGIKLIILPYAAGTANLLSGLIATANNDGAPLMSRAVLRRAAASQPDQLSPNQQPGILRYPIPKSQVPPDDVLRRIRNHISFEIGNEIIWRGPKGFESVTADRMNEIVGKLCRGKFKLKGKAFNPAQHIHYPFNQALLMYDAEERKALSTDPQPLVGKQQLIAKPSQSKMVAQRSKS